MLTGYYWYSDPYNKLSTPWRILQKNSTTYQAHVEMGKFTPEYSMENIPFPGKYVFILSLTDKIIEFIKRMWWKTHFYFTMGAETWREEVEFTEDTAQSIFAVFQPQIECVKSSDETESIMIFFAEINS